MKLFLLLEKYKITPNQWFLISYLKAGIQPKLINAKAEAYICQQQGLLDEHYKCTAKAEQILNDTDSLFKKVKARLSAELMGDNYMEQVKSYHEKFPMGKHPEMNYRYRTTVKELADKFAWFFQTYPEYDWQTVMDATNVYLWEMSRNKHLSTSTDSNFIRKTDQVTRSVKSKLSDYCELLLSGEYQMTQNNEQVHNMYKVIKKKDVETPSLPPTGT